MRGSTLIASARRRAGLTQAQLARRAGTSQPVISAYEHGRRDPGIETLRRLIGATGAELTLGLAIGDDDRIPKARNDAERAARLVDVLLLADAIPSRRRPDAIAFPRLDSSR